MQRIAVDDDLTNVRQALEERGYQVARLHESGDVDAVVVSGMDTNIGGIQNILEGVPVIDASGLTANEVLKEIDDRAHDRI